MGEGNAIGKTALTVEGGQEDDGAEARQDGTNKRRQRMSPFALIVPRSPWISHARSRGWALHLAPPSGTPREQPEQVRVVRMALSSTFQCPPTSYSLWPWLILLFPLASRPVVHAFKLLTTSFGSGTPLACWRSTGSPSKIGRCMSKPS